jgi:hypothetical protein
MKLTDLEAMFLRVESETSFRVVPSLSEAHGVIFLCPKCFAKNGGNVGTHCVVCWFTDRGVPDVLYPRPGRWAVSGAGLKDLTLVPSVHLTGPDGCGWHGFVTNGKAQ